MSATLHGMMLQLAPTKLQMMGKTMHAALPILAFLAAGVLTPCAASAWGNKGHEIVAIAALHILQADAPDVAAKVTQMLAASTDNTLTTHDVGAEATWADAFREHGSKPKSATREWHFIDIETDGPGIGDIADACPTHGVALSGIPASDGPAKSCVTQKIKEFREELGAVGTTFAERVLALKFLLHFVGDVHPAPARRQSPRSKGGNCTGVLPGHGVPISSCTLIGIRRS